MNGYLAPAARKAPIVSFHGVDVPYDPSAFEGPSKKHVDSGRELSWDRKLLSSR